MAQENSPFIIGIPIYQDVDLLDIAAPYEIFNWMGERWKTREVRVYLVAETNMAIATRDGFPLSPHKTFDQVSQLDLLWVPGGSVAALKRQAEDALFLDFLRTRSATATYVTSVCEGALLLASAGLLDGYRVTTHWRFIPCLQKFPEITVEEGYPRFVVCDGANGIRVTGGGISSGLDEALELVKRIGGEEIAKQVQLSTQYFPDPPVQADLAAQVQALKNKGEYCCLVWPEFCDR